MILFEDRRDGGLQLVERLKTLALGDCIVLGLPRGGVPVAFEVARALSAPLDVLVARKLGAPLNRELAIGAIAAGGARVLNEIEIKRLGVTPPELAAIEARERLELTRREALYREGRTPLSLAGRTTVLVDDGLATGATMRAAILAARKLGAARVVAAAPVGAPASAAQAAREADEVVCAALPAFFMSVGSFYSSFPQTSDGEVRALLEQARAFLAECRP